MSKSQMRRSRLGAIEAATSRFHAWLDHSHKGDEFTYHQGLLTEDRWETIYTSMAKQDDGTYELYREVAACEPVHSLAVAVMQAHEKGLVELMQRRLGPADYQYLAIRTRKENSK